MHWLQRRLHCAHLLCLYEIETAAGGGSSQGKPVQPGSADRSGSRFDDTRPDGPPIGRYLYLPGILQNGLPRDLHWSHARYVFATGVAVPFRAWHLQRR